MSIDRTPLAHSILDALLAEGIISLAAFERDLFAWLMQLGCRVVKALFERLDGVVTAQALEDGWRFKAMHGHRIACRFGRFRYERSMVQWVRNGSVRSPLGDHLQLVLGFVTGEAAKLAVRACAGLSTRAAAHLLDDLGAGAPSRSTIVRLVNRFGEEVEERRPEALEILAEHTSPPAQAVAVSVQLDGVMALLVGDRRAELRQRARSEGRKVGGPIGKEECSVGALVYYDADGERLRTVRVARMPQPGKAGLKADLRTLLARALAVRPDLTVVALSDGAPNHWSFLESLDPDYMVVDFFHAAEHVQRRLNRALGVGTHATQATFQALRRHLLDGNHELAFGELVEIERENGSFKPRKKSGRGAQPTFYERHHGRMDYPALRALDLPIGSGEIEGTARYIVVDRLRRTGMRWKRPGGQAVLDLRCAVVNGVFDAVWALVEPDQAELQVLDAA